MRILVCSWGNICEPDLALSLVDMGHHVEVWKRKIKNRDYDLEYLRQLSEQLLKDNYDCVFSINYLPIISRVCNTHRIKYISWTVDSPLFQLNSDTVQNTCNYIFVFDRMLYDKVKGKSNQIYYMPLGANVRFWDSILMSEEEKKHFGCDVSFVGSLYEDKHNYNKVEMPDKLKGYLDGVIEAQTNVYGYNFLDDVITDEVVKEFCECANWSGLGKDYNVSPREIMVTEFLGRKCAEIERYRFVSEIAKKFQFDLYTLSDTSSISHVNNRGAADSRRDMPKIFKSSKININMTIKTIESGIPLRIFDIMGNGGFVITNYQSELLDYFIPGEDLVIYESLSDLIQKISYYLSHEEERQRIADNGYKKVKEQYSVEKRLEEIIEIVWQDKTKGYGIHSYKNKESYLFLHDLFKKIRVKRVLDVGEFLFHYEIEGNQKKQSDRETFHIDGLSLRSETSINQQKEAFYENGYNITNLPKLDYDVVIMIDVLKYFKETQLVYLLDEFLTRAKIVLTDYEKRYEDILLECKEFTIQKLEIGTSCLLMIKPSE